MGGYRAGESSSCVLHARAGRGSGEHRLRRGGERVPFRKNEDESSRSGDGRGWSYRKLSRAVFANFGRRGCGYERGLSEDIGSAHGDGEELVGVGPLERA